MSSTIDLKEVEKFSKIADEWWDESGKFKPLHQFNPTRISFIKSEILNHFNELKDLEIIDVGCGGGLISEPFARMEAKITGIDASERNIAIAKVHAKKSNLKIDYQTALIEEFSKENEGKFDVILALEIIEHIADVEFFIKNCKKILKPNGILFIATMNRTLKSLAFAKFAAEYVLKWLPIGTHDWKKFLKPSEINKYCQKSDLKLVKLSGFEYNIFSSTWKESQNLDINYISVFKRNTII